MSVCASEGWDLRDYKVCSSLPPYLVESHTSLNEITDF
jgi:hypothetical protein